MRRGKPCLVAETADLDCLTCGACCRGHAGVILITEQDLLRFRDSGRPELAEQRAPGHFSQDAIATHADGSCVHLGQPDKPNHCSIYEIRPSICGEFAVGCPQCLAARRSAGIDPPLVSR